MVRLFQIQPPILEPANKYYSYLRYKTGSNVFMDELLNYRSSP
jgi:hypothetical protein